MLFIATVRCKKGHKFLALVEGPYIGIKQKILGIIPKYQNFDGVNCPKCGKTLNIDPKKPKGYIEK